jgi:DNA-binding LacI/PurR family transcriptional regulator
MAVTLKDVALRAGVSASAVSRTFTAGASVSARTRAKVEQASAELGYQPNALASSLTTGRTRLVGLVLNNFHNPAYMEMFDLFTRGLQDRGLRPLLVNLSGETDPAQSVRMLRQYSVDAAVVASSTLPTGFSAAFVRAGIPVVRSFGRAGRSRSRRAPVVGIDNVECGRMAARELVARGYRRVGFLGGPKSATSTQDRMTGFLDEIARHGGVEASHSFAADYSFRAGRAEMLRLLAGRPAEAYFCGDDVLSIGAMSAIEGRGLAVPGDIGLIGLNDMEMSGWENIDLTTIRQPMREIVEASIELVQAMLDSPEAEPASRVFPCRLVERGSLRPRPGVPGAGADPSA